MGYFLLIVAFVAVVVIACVESGRRADRQAQKMIEDWELTHPPREEDPDDYDG